jgi:hypothetical protein
MSIQRIHVYQTRQDVTSSFPLPTLALRGHPSSMQIHFLGVSGSHNHLLPFCRRLDSLWRHVTDRSFR